jgi:hypothetical protein
VANQGAIIKSLETQIGQLSKLVTTYVSIDIARNTVDNPKEECKTLTEKELKHERDWEELMEFKRWFAALGMTLEEQQAQQCHTRRQILEASPLSIRLKKKQYQPYVT